MTRKRLDRNLSLRYIERLLIAADEYPRNVPDDDR